MGIEKGIGEEDGRIRAVVGRAGGALLHETVLHQRVRRQAAERPGAEAVARISALGGLAEVRIERALQQRRAKAKQPALDRHFRDAQDGNGGRAPAVDRKSTRLNSSHDQISYAVFCLKKKKQKTNKDN